MRVTPEKLNRVMDFDHVIHVDETGEVTEPSGVWAPSLLDGELDSSSWELLDGYSMQDSYSGPIMHNSEFIGGQLARDILATPGYYVAIVSSYSPEEEDGETDIEGWAIAYRETL